MTIISRARQAETVKIPGYHRAGPGLYLQIKSSGSKSWIFRYKSPVTGKQREMGLGSFSLISLAEARALAAEYKKQVFHKLDPILERNKTNQKKLNENSKNYSFQQLATQYIEIKTPEWSNKKHANQWTSSLTNYVFPTLGNLPVNQIDTLKIISVLKPIWITKPETASRVRQRVEAVIDYAKAKDLYVGENPARLKGHIDHLLPRISKIKQVKHHKALPYHEIGKFMNALNSHNETSALALKFLIFTASRTREVTEAKWSEIDLSDKNWIIPAERMKARKAHRVPLSTGAIQVLQTAQDLSNKSDFIFIGGKPNSGLSNNAMLALLKRMNFSHVTTHGFRSTFRDWAAEQAYEFQNETVELALAHTIKNKTEAAYRRGDQLERRRELMERWSEYANQN